MHPQYLSMRATLPLSMEKVHKVAPLVSILDKLYSLHDEIRAGPHPPNSKENVVSQKVRCQSLHYYNSKTYVKIL